jgi:hypothetical protein
LYRVIFLILFLTSFPLISSAQNLFTVTGRVTSEWGDPVPHARVSASSGGHIQQTTTDSEGRFEFSVSTEDVTIVIEGENIRRFEKVFNLSNREEIPIQIDHIVRPYKESLIITDHIMEPFMERMDDTVFRDTLFSRDDQILHILNAGINSGQHEGGGKSLEVRRFGFNLDHGGVSGGLKVLVDGVQQNHVTQGHGQGYLGQLKTVIPELVDEVDILNGPFSAQYGDFSGLGVVHIRLKESIFNQFTTRLQFGSFNSSRAFVAFSPELKKSRSFLAYERSRSDGPFLNPLNYRRDNITGSYTVSLSKSQDRGIKIISGRNTFTSSGQLPLDLVANGDLDRFGYIDPDLGGHTRTGTAAVYYKKDWASGGTLRLDGFVNRSLFDLYSNFTFFLNNPLDGDGIQQHDSRVQEGVNALYLKPLRILGRPLFLEAGINYSASQINTGLSTRINRSPTDSVTAANAGISNSALYLQNTFHLGRLQLKGGIRYDHFHFSVRDRLAGVERSEGAGRLQPKLNLSFSLADILPATLYLNYGRGIASQDARGIVAWRESPKISSTDFFQFGTSHRLKMVTLSTALFLIDRSNEQVYIPDDGSIEFRAASRSYGFEVKSSFKITNYLSVDTGLTRVMNAFYKGTLPRIYLDSAPHRVAHTSLSLSNLKGLNISLRYRHAGSYRLDGEDAGLRASGLDVVDLGIRKAVRRWMDLELSVDNLTNKRYYETQNYFESRASRNSPAMDRIHGTPGYPISFNAGATIHLFRK